MLWEVGELIVGLHVIEPSPLLVREMVQVVGPEASILSVDHLVVAGAGRFLVLLTSQLLCLGVSLGSEISEGSRSTCELAAHFSGLVAGIRVHVVVLVHISGQKVHESLIFVSWNSSFDTFSLGSLLLLLLSHSEEGVEKAEGGNDKHDEEVHDLEGDVSLSLQVIPLVLNSLKVLRFGCFWLKSDCFLSSWCLLKLRNLLKLLW